MNNIIDILKGSMSALLSFSFFLIPQVRAFVINQYQHSLDESLEDKKSKNERKTHVSKVRFDKEFEIHEKLSKAFSELVMNTNGLIPDGCYFAIPNESEEQDREKEYLYNTVVARNDALDILRQNAIFISKDFYVGYSNVICLVDKQLALFTQRDNAKVTAPVTEKFILTDDDCARTLTLNQELEKLNDNIRIYLTNLEIIE